MLLPLILAGVPVLKRRIFKPKFSRLEVSFCAFEKPFGPESLVQSPIIILLLRYTPVAKTTASQTNFCSRAVVTIFCPFSSIETSITSPCLRKRFGQLSRVIFI